MYSHNIVYTNVHNNISHNNPPKKKECECDKGSNDIETRERISHHITASGDDQKMLVGDYTVLLCRVEVAGGLLCGGRGGGWEHSERQWVTWSLGPQESILPLERILCSTPKQQRPALYVPISSSVIALGESGVLSQGVPVAWETYCEEYELAPASQHCLVL